MSDEQQNSKYAWLKACQEKLKPCQDKLKGAWAWYKGLYQGKPWYVKVATGTISLILAFILYLGAVDVNFLWLFGK